MLHINPTTEAITEVAQTPLELVPSLVEGSLVAQRAWSALAVAERSARLRSVARRIAAQRDELAETITREMGKPVTLARSEVDRSAAGVEYFCDHAAEWLAPETVPGGEVFFDPLGTVGVISPWNFPIWLPMQAVVQALLPGNAVILKPSEIVPCCGLLLGEAFNNDELPKGLLQVVIGDRVQGELLVKHPEIAAISFTGSIGTGRALMAAAAASLKKLSLELGGLDAAVVLKDADVVAAARELVRNNAQNSGQVCIAVKRVFVERDVYEPFLAAAAAESAALRCNDPLQEGDALGPLASAAQLGKVEQFVADALEKGATVLSGGVRVPGRGFFFPHTVVSNVDESMRLMREEPFGPILPVMPVADWREAVMRANGVEYGLGASVWSRDETRAFEVARYLQAGVVKVNGHGAGPLGAPFGGTKQSGIGRLRWRDGLREFCNVKYVQRGA